jgi:hypothetical protein
LLLRQIDQAGKRIVNQKNKNMKIIDNQIRPLTLALLLTGGLAFSSCSTGTKDGDASVEKSDYKDKDPNEHNVEASGQPSTDTTGNMAEPYERAEKTTDKNSDGMADTPGTQSEHIPSQEH